MNDYTQTTWSPDSVAVEHRIGPRVPVSTRTLRLHGLRLWRDGSLVRITADDQHPERGGEPIEFDEMADRFGRWLDETREVLLTLGAHGDVRLVYGFGGLAVITRQLSIRNVIRDMRRFRVQVWTSLDPGAHEAGMREQVLAEVARSVGLGPR